MIFKPGYVEYSSTGTTHGSPYSYDTHVPLIFFGWNIKKGQTHDRKEITQIAPTVTQMLKITIASSRWIRKKTAPSWHLTMNSI